MKKFFPFNPLNLRVWPEERWLHTPLPSNEVLLKCFCNAPEKTWVVVTLAPLYLGRNHVLRFDWFAAVSCLLPAFSRLVWWHGPGSTQHKEINNNHRGWAMPKRVSEWRQPIWPHTLVLFRQKLNKKTLLSLLLPRQLAAVCPPQTPGEMFPS